MRDLALPDKERGARCRFSLAGLLAVVAIMARWTSFEKRLAEALAVRGRHREDGQLGCPLGSLNSAGHLIAIMRENLKPNIRHANPLATTRAWQSKSMSFPKAPHQKSEHHQDDEQAAKDYSPDHFPAAHAILTCFDRVEYQQGKQRNPDIEYHSTLWV